MKKALAILVLLSVTLLSMNGHLHADSKAPADFDKLMLELSSLSQKFSKAASDLFKIRHTLKQIAKEQYDLGKDTEATAIAAAVDSIKDIDSRCGLTSDILFVGSLAKEKYYSVLVNYLRQGVEHEKRLLEDNFKSLRDYYNDINSDAALPPVNKAIDAIRRILVLYNEALVLLPLEK